jgi:hypothetical protein
MTTYGALGAAIAAAILAVPDWLKVPGAFAIIAGLVIWRRPRHLVEIDRLLLSRHAPLVLGIVAALAMVAAWGGSLRQIPFLQDEAAYMLQAHLFAAGRWADPAPPIPVFFEQPHVLVVPTYASKYFPGHSLLLTPGVWLGLPGLVPVILLGLTGALTFAIVRDLFAARFGPWPALLAYILWLSLLGYHTWPRPSYMSEISTSALWVIGWWALLQWRSHDRRTVYLAILAVCIAWGAITRPLTMLAFAVPTGLVVLTLVWRRRRWTQLAVASGCGAAVLAIIPLWSARTTGSWRVTPLALYTAQYLPWDIVGFGYRDTKPLRATPPEVACLDTTFADMHRLHEPRVLPGQLLARSWGLLDDTFADWRRGLLLFALVALAWLPAELWVALGTCVTLLVAYLVYPQDPRYTVYYMETQTTLVAVAAVGVCCVAASIGMRLGRRPAEELQNAARRHVEWWVAGSMMFLIPVTMLTLRLTGHLHQGTDVPHREFLQRVRSLPQARTVVFVRYPPAGPCSQAEQSLITNTPPLATARTWIVYDRGAENAALLERARDRAPYTFDAASGALRPLRDEAMATRLSHAAR